ncbi:MAG: c-type cytochrome, partial [Gammaproteobacteria bacterium]
GRRANSAPMWAAYVAYPKYRSKNHQVNTLEERIQGCFRFSMNGKPPAADSPDMDALVSYFHWLATGLPVGITPKGASYLKLQSPPLTPNIQRGAKVYASSCAMCHGNKGEGRDAHGEPVFPPLWGSKSFNWGAGMERISTAAGFIKANMPYGAGDTLTDQQAWDVATFVVSHPRPQDPRFTGSVEATRKKFHNQDSYYGRIINGQLLGAPQKPGP